MFQRTYYGPRKVPLEDIPLIITRYENGEYISDIAKQYGVHSNAIISLMRKRGIVIRQTKPRRKRKDIIGQRFGRLVVISRTGFRNRKTFWLCQCDCGNTTEQTYGSLKSKNAESCGCFSAESASNRLIGKWGLKPGESRFRDRLNAYKYRAEIKRIEWQLSDEDVRNLFASNCYYCGVPPSNRSTKTDLQSEFIYNGIDRVDNSVGYTKGNCVPCCKACNYGKKDMDVRDFLSWVDRVYEYTHRKLGI